MGTADLRLGDAFKLLLLGGAVGAVGMFVLGNIKSVQFQANRAYWGGRRAYPSYFWDFRDPGASAASFNKWDYEMNGIPREGMFTAPDPNFEEPNFSEAYGPAPYTAPRDL